MDAEPSSTIKCRRAPFCSRPPAACARARAAANASASSTSTRDPQREQQQVLELLREHAARLAGLEEHRRAEFLLVRVVGRQPVQPERQPDREQADQERGGQQITLRAPCVGPASRRRRGRPSSTPRGTRRKSHPCGSTAHIPVRRRSREERSTASRVADEKPPCQPRDRRALSATLHRKLRDHRAHAVLPTHN